MSRIAIDPGHGGPRDPGVVVGGIRECDVALIYSLALSTELQGRGHTVHMTRSTDTDLAPTVADKWKGLDLTRRSARANDFNAAAFVSIHCNANARAAANGAWVLHAHQSARGKALAHAIFAQLALIPGIPDTDPAQEVYPDGSPYTGYTEAARAALARRPANSTLSAERWLETTGLPRSRWYRTISVLQRTKMPAVLVELGFLTNPEDRAQLLEPETSLRVAVAIANGIDCWLAGS